MTSFPVMLARSYQAERVTDWSSLTVEPKLDGVRVVAKCMNNGVVQFFSRNGRALGMFDHLTVPLLMATTHLRHKYGPTMIDGEMRVGDTFEATGGAIHRKNHTVTEARLHVFFAMPWNKFREGHDTVTQAARTEALEALWHNAHDAPLHLVRATSVTANTMVEAAYESFLEEGYEGAMIKQTHTVYGDRRSFDWMKLKAEHTVDLRVVRLQPGRGKYANTLGALVVKFKGREVPVSGMTDEQRAAWWGKPKAIIGKTIEVQYQYATANGSLRHPRFKRLRPDKD